MCTHTHIRMPVGARGQPWVLSSESSTVSFEAGSPTGTYSLVRLGWCGQWAPEWSSHLCLPNAWIYKSTLISPCPAFYVALGSSQGPHACTTTLYWLSYLTIPISRNFKAQYGKKCKQSPYCLCSLCLWCWHHHILVKFSCIKHLNQLILPFLLIQHQRINFFWKHSSLYSPSQYWTTYFNKSYIMYCK